MSVTQPQWDLGLCADKMATVALGLLCVVVVVGLVTAAPARTYDQRQQGELNIHAQFDNIVVLLIPSSKINLMDVSPESTENNLTQAKPGNNAFLDFLQNHIKNDIDRYDDVQQPQHVSLGHEEEVVATVEEMRPDKESPEKTTEGSAVKEEVKDSSVGESVQDTSLKISIPVEDAVKKTENKDKENKKERNEPQKIAEKVEKVSNEAVKPTAVKDFVLTKKEQQPLEKKEDTSVARSGSLLDALIKPVAARSSESAAAGVRREKVMRYKPEAKWAPGLVDVLGPVRQERQRFDQVCAPGLWDPELKTCITPGETRR